MVSVPSVLQHFCNSSRTNFASITPIQELRIFSSRAALIPVKLVYWTEREGEEEGEVSDFELGMEQNEKSCEGSRGGAGR